MKQPSIRQLPDWVAYFKNAVLEGR